MCPIHTSSINSQFSSHPKSPSSLLSPLRPSLFFSQVISSSSIPQSLDMASGAGSPCGACKFLLRKCASDCIFAPYFNSDQGPAWFAAIHKIFGASNASKLLLHVPPPDQCEAVVTIAYEAQARIRDPVYGCVAHIFALEQQVAIWQAQLMQLKAQLAHSIAGSQLSGDQWQGNITNPRLRSSSNMQTMYPKRSFDCVDYSSDGMVMQEMGSKEDLPTQHCTKRRVPHNELGELQALALRMMGS